MRHLPFQSDTQLKDFALNVFVAILGILFALTVRADSPTMSVEQTLKDPYVSGCVAEGVRKGRDNASVKAICECSWSVIASNLTVREYSELAASNAAPNAFPAVQRIKGKLALCKSGVTQ